MAKQSAGWDKLYDDATTKFAYQRKILDVKASFWGMGRDEEEIEKEARRRLREEDGLEIPEPRRGR